MEKTLHSKFVIPVNRIEVAKDARYGTCSPRQYKPTSSHAMPLCTVSHIMKDGQELMHDDGRIAPSCYYFSGCVQGEEVSKLTLQQEFIESDLSYLLDESRVVSPMDIYRDEHLPWGHTSTPSATRKNLGIADATVETMSFDLVHLAAALGPTTTAPSTGMLLLVVPLMTGEVFVMASYSCCET